MRLVCKIQFDYKEIYREHKQQHHLLNISECSHVPETYKARDHSAAASVHFSLLRFQSSPLSPSA